MLQDQVQDAVAALTPTVKATMQFPSEAIVTTSIWLLARTLHFDPALIFEYVHNHIDYVPTFGAANGASGTLWAGRGNDFDQSSLFIALLRASGYTANYMRGIVGYPMSRLANWLGVDEEQVPQVVANGGMIGVVDPPGDRMRLFRYWATVDIDGQTYWFDPAMKEYEDVTGIDLQTVLGYDRAAFLTRAGAGAEVTSDSVRNLNETNVRADLVTYSMNLVNYLRQSMPEASIEDVLGGRRIVPVELTAYSTVLPYALSVEDEFARDEMPDASRHTLRIRYGGIDHTFATSEIAGRRITLIHLGENNDQAALLLDGVIIATGNTVEFGEFYPCTVEVDHPYPAENGIYADEAYTFDVLGGAFYVLAHDFGDVSPWLLASRRDYLAQAHMYGLQDTELVWCESLWLIGLGWLQQVHLLMGMLDRLGDTRTPLHHALGLIGPVVGYTMDIGMFVYSCNAADANVDTRGVSRAIRVIYSALESAVLEQVQDASRPAVSATRLLQLNNALGRRTFLAHAGNWATIRPQLVNYREWRLQALTDDINDGWRLVLPEDANVRLVDWVGLGYISYLPGWEDLSVGLTIGGDYTSGGSGGGQVATMSTLDRTMLLEALEYWGGVPSDQDPAVSTPQSGDPIDMATGACVYATTDVAAGPGEPFGLRLQRSYNSGTHYYEQVLGRGWRHNYEMMVQQRSKGDLALGMGQPAEAAGMIAAAYVVTDLLPGEADIVEWVTSVVAGKWAADQVLHNTLTVQLGSQVLEFTRLPDGSYSPPPGMMLRLTEEAGRYLLENSSGARYEFDTAGKIVHWQDANDNALAFAYDASGLLQNVSNGLGITLTFTYSGTQLSQVSDMAGRSVSYGYTDGNLTSYRDAMGNMWRYEYDEENRLVAIYSPNHPTTAMVTNVYNVLNQVQTQTDGLGNVTSFAFSGFHSEEQNPDGSSVTHYFDDKGNNVGREDSLGNRTVMAYDGLWRLREVTDRLGDSTSFAYDPQSGRLSSYTDAEGNTTTYAYTPRALPGGGSSDLVYDLTRIAHADGSHEDLAYDTRGNLLTYSDGLGKTWSYAYNERGQPLTAINPTGGVVSYTYHADGLLATTTDSDVGTTHLSYDAHKRLITLTWPDGSTVHFSYGLNDRLLSTTDERGKTTTFTYDANGNLATATNPLSQTVTYAYDVLDRLAARTDPVGQVGNLSYDAMGRLASITDRNGYTDTYTYNSRGWLSQLTDAAGQQWNIARDDEAVPSAFGSPAGITTTLQTDKLGRTTAVTNGLGAAIHLAYDDLGRLTVASDALGRAANYAYDAAGRMVSATRPLIGAATYTRDDLGLLSRITDQRGNGWGFDHSQAGRLMAESDPLGNGWTYDYDTRGRLTQVTYPGIGQFGNLSYDAASRVTEITYPGGLTLTYGYDDAGRLLTANSRWLGQTVGVTLTYDARGDITGSQAGSAFFGATYDNGQRLRTVTYDSPATVTYTYDARNLLTRVEDNLCGAWVAFAYDTDGRLIQISRSNGVSTTYSYDSAGRLTRIQDGTLADQQYTLNAEGEVTAVARTLPLDPVPVGQIANLSYNDASQISSAGYAYDARGRQTAAPGETYSYDGAGRLTTITAGGSTAALTYNGLGDLHTRTVGGTTTTYYHNYALRRGPIVAESVQGSMGADPAQNAGRSTREQGSRGAGEQAPQHPSSLAPLHPTSLAPMRFYVYTPGGSLLYSMEPATCRVRFYHFDRIGSTLFLTDGSGVMSDAYAYNAYGNPLGHTGSSDQPFTYIGRYGVRWEPIGSLYEMGARYYDPLAARFLTRDPLWPPPTEPQGLNPYQYAFQNPLRHIDPLGTQTGGSAASPPAGGSGRESVGKEVAGRLPGDTQPAGTGSRPGSALDSETAWYTIPPEQLYWFEGADVPGEGLNPQQYVLGFQLVLNIVAALGSQAQANQEYASSELGATLTAILHPEPTAGFELTEEQIQHMAEAAHQQASLASLNFTYGTSPDPEKVAGVYGQLEEYYATAMARISAERDALAREACTGWAGITGRREELEAQMEQLLNVYGELVEQRNRYAELRIQTLLGH